MPIKRKNFIRTLPPSLQSNIIHVEQGDAIRANDFNSIAANVDKENHGPGVCVGSSTSTLPSPPAINQTLLNVENSTENQSQDFYAGYSFEPGAAICPDANFFPYYAFSQQNALSMNKIYCWDGVNLGITRVDVGQSFGGEAIIMGPSYSKIIYPESPNENADPYQYIIPIPGDPTKLMAAPYGNGRILWSRKPDPPTDSCEPFETDGYVNLGDACWWQFFKLEEDLHVCSSAPAVICDECGTPIPGPEQTEDGCVYRRTVWLAKLNCDEASIPKDKVVIAFWFTCFKKWICINWENPCPDFDEFTPEEDNIVRTYKPIGFTEVEPEAESDPCDGGCGLLMNFEVNKYYNDDCNDNFCYIETETMQVPVPLPDYTGFVPVNCYVTDSGTDFTGEDCECTGGRVIQIEYPEIHIVCGKICETGRTAFSQSCDISLTQDTTLTQYGPPVIRRIEPSETGDCVCSPLKLIPKTRQAKIACDEWCVTDWTEATDQAIDLPIFGEDDETTFPILDCPTIEIESRTGIDGNGDPTCLCTYATLTFPKKTVDLCGAQVCINDETANDECTVEIPVPPENGGQITYVDNVLLEAADCGSFQYRIQYGRMNIRCGAFCEPETSTFLSSPNTIRLWDELILTGGEDQTVLTGIASGTIPVTLGGFQSTTIELNGSAANATIALDNPVNQTVNLTGELTGATVNLTGDTSQNVSVSGTCAGTVSLTNEDQVINVDGACSGSVTLSGTESRTVVVTGTCQGGGRLSTTETEEVDVNVLGTCSGNVTLTDSQNQTVNLTGELTGATVNLTGGSQQTFLTDVSASISNLPITINLEQITGGTISGNITINIPIAKKTVVTAVSVDNCNVVGTTEDIWVLAPASAPAGNAGDLAITANASGLTFTPTTASQTVNATATGPISVQTSTGTVSVPTSGVISGGSISASGTVQVPTSGTICGITISGNGSIQIPTTASFDASALSAQSATIRIPTRAECSTSEGGSE